ncbi:hypothetical protein DRQ27_00510 [bacterium]|nr:MAG: hypothetical protein DRQ27_00510 [bacterium]
MIVHDKIKFALIVLIFLTAFNAAYSQQKSPWRVLAENVLKCVPDTDAIFILRMPVLYDTLVKICEETGTHSKLKIFLTGKEIIDKLPELKKQKPIYALGICNSLMPYIVPESLSMYGLIQKYNPSAESFVDTSYKLLMQCDLSCFDDPLYFYGGYKYSYSAQIGNVISNIYAGLRGKNYYKKDSLVKKLKPYLKNLPTLVDAIIDDALDNDTTSVHGMSVDTLLDILQDWCDRNEDVFFYPMIKGILEMERERYFKLKQKKKPNP